MPFVDIAASSTVPPQGDIGGGGFGLGPCPAGTRCIGPSATIFGQTVCLGTCANIAFPPVGGGGPGGGGPPPDQPFGPEICTPGLRSACAGAVNPGGQFTQVCNGCQFQIGVELPLGGGNGGTGGGFGGFPQNGANGAGCACGARTSPSAACACCLPGGGQGKTNKSRYYRFGDLRRGTTAGVVQKGTVCVPKRKTNFGNAKAARTAVSRLKGARTLLHDINQLTKTINKGGRRRRRR